VLDRVLQKLPRPTDPNLLVGIAASDDAGVYRVSDELALVQTVDFFTPIVDDPYQYGQVAAANSLSDVYAMGGRPLTALSIVAFPEKGDEAVLERVLAGGLAKMSEAGCVLTKAIGTGVITTALKAGTAQEDWVEAAVKTMSELNRGAAGALSKLGDAVHAATDITGFGLLGHAREVALASGASLALDSREVTLIPGAFEAARAGNLAGGLKANREFLAGCVEFGDSVAEEVQDLFYDPQTSGGLLVAVAAEQVDAARKALAEAGCPAMVVGEVVEKTSPLIAIR
jgi:selenide,water dikinase